jgi:NADH-quinone oxidoreductase subunit G
MSAPPRKVTVTIDGRTVEVEEGLPLIEAAARVGVDIPRFCYHPHLSVAGNCRMCAVEVEKARGLPISCATPCTEGLVARTDTEAVKKHRAAVMEFLLVNHPIDCPICDQAGECWLQIYYMEHDRRDSRLGVEKVHYDKRIPVGPRVVLDQERCVECTRCIRFCDEVTKTGELRMANRGDRNVITTFPGRPLDNPYSVNTADICPVGALTQTDFRFRARVWFLKEAPTICPGCARGCNVTVDYGFHEIVTDHNGQAYRIRPRVNDGVNQAWMCDFGRTEYRRVNDDRLEAALGPRAAASLEEAVAGARTALLGARGRVVVLGGLEATLEEMMLLRAFAAEVLPEGTAAYLPDRPPGFSDDFLIHADKHPNRRGAEWLGLLRPPEDAAELLAGAAAVLVHRVDLLALDATGAVRSALEAVPVRVAVAANRSATTALATHLLPAVSFLEKDGLWVNAAGRVQRVRRAPKMKPRPGTACDLEILAGLSGGRLPSTAAEVYARYAPSVPALQGLRHEDVGPLGVVPLPVGDGALR